MLFFTQILPTATGCQYFVSILSFR